MNHANPAMTPQQRHFAVGSSPFALYKELQVGKERPWHELATFEIVMALGGLPGCLGMVMRSGLYPMLLRSCRGRPAFGRGVVIRNPSKIELGRRVLIDDYSFLEARGSHASVMLGDHVTLGRFSSVVAKQGRVVLHHGVNIGSSCRIATQSFIEIGESSLVAAYVYIGPGNHQEGTGDTPLIEREMEVKGGVRIGKHAWIGAHTTILDGVTIGDGAIVGAHSLVRESVEARTVVAGIARMIRRLDDL